MSSPTATRADQSSCSSSIGPAIGSSDGSAKSNIARISSLLGGDLRVGRLRHARAEVVDLEHLDVRADLRVHGGEVRVHVEHAGIGVAHEADARTAQRAATPAARTQSAIFAHARSSSSIVPATVSYGIRARVNAPASSGTQQAAQLASHSPVPVFA